MATKIKIRSMVVSRPGYAFIMCDLSQAETWIVAYLAREENMKRALLFGDIHTQTAGSALFNKTPQCDHDWNKETQTCRKCGDIVIVSERYIGKKWNHATSYRMGPERATQVVNKDSDKFPFVTITVKDAREYSKHWKGYYNLQTWWNEIDEKLNRDRIITTTYGRRRTFYGAWGPELQKEATAHEPQSTVADHFNGMVHPELGIKGGLIEVYRQFVKNGPLFLNNQSHDSLMAECPINLVDEFAPQIVQTLRRPLIVNGEEFTIPVDCEVGDRWGELESYKI